MAISTLQISPALLREQRMALSRRKKKLLVLPGSSGTTSGGGDRAPIRSSGQLMGKPKANELASTSHSSPQTDGQHLVMGPHLCPLMHRLSQVIKPLPAAGKSCPHKGGVIYAALLAGTVTPF